MNSNPDSEEDMFELMNGRKAEISSKLEGEEIRLFREQEKSNYSYAAITSAACNYMAWKYNRYKFRTVADWKVEQYG